MKGEYGSNLAVKIIRNNSIMKKAAEKELEILKVLNDPSDRNNIVRLLDSAEHKEHVIMCFEGFSFNLREVLNKFGKGVGLSIDAVRSYSRQMLNGLYHMGKQRVIHQDLKPDNILVSADFLRIKVRSYNGASFLYIHLTYCFVRFPLPSGLTILPSLRSATWDLAASRTTVIAAPPLTWCLVSTGAPRS